MISSHAVFGEVTAAIVNFRKAYGELPERIFLPAETYDVSIDVARIWYPGIQFVRDDEIAGLLLVQRDPESIN